MRTPIKLLFDARKILDGGIGVYSQNIIESLSSNDSIIITLLINPSQKEKISELSFSWAEKVDWIEDSAKVLSLDEFFNLTRRVDFTKFDLYHTPFISLPARLSIPAIITIHDLIQITHPEKFFYPILARLIIGRSIKLAKGVLTVSQSSAQLINRNFLSTAKIEIIPNVLSATFKTPQNINLCEITSDLEQKRFIVALYSNLKPHKRCPDLVDVFLALLDEPLFPKDLQLVLVGKGFDGNINPELSKKIKGCSRILALNEISEEHLVTIMKRAEALIISSIVEGFSLPVIQAHSQGTPVITRPIPAVKELLGEGDTIAKDYSKSSLKEAVLDFFKNNRNQKYSYDLSNYELSDLSVKLIAYYKKILQK